MNVAEWSDDGIALRGIADLRLDIMGDGAVRKRPSGKLKSHRLFERCMIAQRVCAVKCRGD